MPVVNRSYKIIIQDGVVVMAGVTNDHGETGLYQTDKIENVSVRFSYSESENRMQCQPL